MLDAHLRQFLETSDSSKQNIFPLFHHILYRHETNQQLKIQIYVTNFFLGKAECNYSYRVLFLTDPPNFQYQNENRWAANQRFCSMKFSTYKISSLVEKRFYFLHWNLGGTVKKLPCIMTHNFPHIKDILLGWHHCQFLQKVIFECFGQTSNWNKAETCTHIVLFWFVEEKYVTE